MRILRRSLSATLGPAAIALALTLLYVAILVVLAGDPLVLVTLGADFAPAELQPHVYSPRGYDGQFAYYLARYGLDAAPYLDVPAYRAQRMLLPLLARVLSLGQPPLVIWTLLVVNLCGLAAGTFWLGQLLARRQASRWLALGFAMSLGMFGAVRMTTTEPLAYALAIGGLSLVDRERWAAAGVAFGLAALGKETTLLIPAACAMYALFRRRIGIAIAITAAAWIPFVVWQWVLHSTFGTVGVGSGGANTTGFEIVPFMGLVRPIAQAVRGSHVEIAIVVAALMGVFVVWPVVWSAGQLLVRLRSLAHWSFVTWLLAANASVIPFVPASTFAEPLGMFRLIAGLQIAVILFAAEQRRAPVLAKTMFWSFTTLLLLVTDAGYVARR